MQFGAITVSCSLWPGLFLHFRAYIAYFILGVLAVSVATEQFSLTGLEILRLRLLMFTYLQYVM